MLPRSLQYGQKPVFTFNFAGLALNGFCESLIIIVESNVYGKCYVGLTIIKVLP